MVSAYGPSVMDRRPSEIRTTRADSASARRARNARRRHSSSPPRGPGSAARTSASVRRTPRRWTGRRPCGRTTGICSFEPPRSDRVVAASADSLAWSRRTGDRGLDIGERNAAGPDAARRRRWATLRGPCCAVSPGPSRRAHRAGPRDAIAAQRRATTSVANRRSERGHAPIPSPPAPVHARSSPSRHSWLHMAGSDAANGAAATNRAAAAGREPRDGRRPTLDVRSAAVDHRRSITASRYSLGTTIVPSSARLNRPIKSSRSASRASRPASPTASNAFSVGP